MTSRTITTISHTIMICVIALTAYILLQSYSTYQKIQNITEIRHALISLAQELQESIQSSSNSARTYVNTANQNHKNAFKSIHDERTGYSIRQITRLIYPSQQFDLILFIQKQPLNLTEAGHIQSIQVLSDKLLELETEAITLVKGQYTGILRNMPNQQRAQNILFNQPYTGYQENILQHISYFMQAVNTRTTKAINTEEVYMEHLGIFSILGIISILLIAYWSMYHSHRVASMPLQITKPSTANKKQKIPQYLDNNIIHLHRSMSTMFQKINTHLIDIEQAVQHGLQGQTNTKNIHSSDAINETKLLFLARIHHEFRTPMNAILNMPLFLLNTKLTNTQQEYVHKIINAGQSLFTTLCNMLDYAEITHNKTCIIQKDFNLFEDLIVINDITLQWSNAKKLHFSMHVDPSIPKCLQGDPMRLKQILINLLSNAIKFTSEGHVTLNIKALNRSQNKVYIGFLVEDTGIGITEQDQKRIFNDFAQSEDSMTFNLEDAGLGLSLSAKLATLMKGCITVTSKPNVGSTFYLELPFHYTREQNSNDNDNIIDNSTKVVENISFSKKTPPDFTGLRCMLVEDNLINQEIMTTLLESLNINVEVCNNGQEALTLYTKDQNFDCIFMDIQMPVMDGYAATKAIRKSAFANSDRIPILALTAHASTKDRQKSFDASMSDHLTKPIELQEIISALTKWCLSKKTRP